MQQDKTQDFGQSVLTMTPVYLIFVVALAWEVGLGCKGYAQLGKGFTAPSHPCSSM